MKLNPAETAAKLLSYFNPRKGEPMSLPEELADLVATAGGVIGGTMLGTAIATGSVAVGVVAGMPLTVGLAAAYFVPSPIERHERRAGRRDIPRSFLLG